MWVLHRCDNKWCVAPDHLFLGTNKDNQVDSVLKGKHRSGCLPGEKNGRAKLTSAQVEEIRRTAKCGTYSKLGRRYGVSGQQIRRIANGESW